MKNWMKEAAILTAGLVIMGFLLRSAVVNLKERDRVVSVRGLAEKDVAANKVTWPLTYKVLGNDLGSLYNEIKEWISLAWDTDQKRFRDVLLEMLRLSYLLPVFVNIGAALEKWKGTPEFATSVRASAESCQGKLKDALLQMSDGQATTDQILKLWQSTEDSQ